MSAKIKFPKRVTVQGIPKLFATVYRQKQCKASRVYTSYTLAYSLLGKLKRETFAELDLAVSSGQEAIKRMANDEQRVLELSNRDADAYLRAKAKLPPGIDLETAATECAELRAILNGSGTPIEAARFFVKVHNKKLPRIAVSKAAEECLAGALADGKSKARRHQLEHYLKGFSDSHNIEVAELTPGIVSRYLTGMVASDRTKKNARDVIGYFGRWLVLHGYLDRGTDLVEGVQKYGNKLGRIEIYTPAEISRLIEKADDRLMPYLTIGAFAGVRGAEIQRLDWSEIGEEFIEVKAEKAKTKTRRLIPIKANLTAWLKDYREKSGPVCPFLNVVNQLMKLARDAKLTWRKNALRHSYISYRVAECADVARVSDESGNSPAVIRSNYLERVKPAQAAEWFAVMPAAAVPDGKISKIPTAAK